MGCQRGELLPQFRSCQDQPGYCPAIKHSTAQTPSCSSSLYLRPANIHPQTGPYPANSQVTVSPCPSQPQHRAGPPLSCSPGQEGNLLLSQARQAPGKATGAGKMQSNADVRKPLTQQNRGQLQATGTVRSTTSIQAALCCTAQGRLNLNTEKNRPAASTRKSTQPLPAHGGGSPEKLHSPGPDGEVEQWGVTVNQ